MENQPLDTAIEALPPEERASAYERAGRVRRFARTVLRTVMAETAAEAQRPQPLNIEPLAHAAEDLQTADQELGQTMQRVNSEKLGVVAVLTAGSRYLARRRVAQRPGAGQTMNAQRAAFNQLRQHQTAAMAPQERADYYGQLEQFTHHQAEVTRQTNQELQQAATAERPRYTWRQERAPEPLIATEHPEQTPERLPGQAATDAPRAAAATAPAAAPVMPTLKIPEPPKKAPLNPTAIKQEVARKALAAQTMRKLWLYGAAAAAVVVAIVLFIKLG